LGTLEKFFRARESLARLARLHRSPHQAPRDVWLCHSPPIRALPRQRHRANR